MNLSIRRVFLSFLLVAFMCGSAAFADPVKEVQAAVAEQQFDRALALAQALTESPEPPAELANVLFKGGRELVMAKRLGEGAGFYRLLLDHYPAYEKAAYVRGEIAACYALNRDIEECIAQCQTNLVLDSESEWVEYWQFLIAQSEFKRRNFAKAGAGFEALLKASPDGDYANKARSYQKRIDPVWKIDANGIAIYSGKFEEDIRLQAAIAALPGHIKEGYTMLEKTLGVDLKPHARIEYVIEDTPPGTSSGLKGQAKMIARNGEAISWVRMFTERVITNPESYRRTAIHEIKHAGFLSRMGGDYHDLPNWIREGLAVWGSGDTDNRIHQVLSNAMAGKREPMKVLDGIENLDRKTSDYMEDSLAFEWLSQQGDGKVQAFCRRLVEGEAYQEIWADLCGKPYEQALQEANAHCRKRVEAQLGPGYESFLPLYRESEAAFRKGKAASKDWLANGGETNFDRWLEDYPGHVAEPLARLFFARVMITAGNHQKARPLLLKIQKEDRARANVADDAQFWLGASYNYAGEATLARQAFAVLLRDYPNASTTKQFKGKLRPAPPVTR